jgi:hypothetical protein
MAIPSFTFIDGAMAIGRCVRHLNEIRSATAHARKLPNSTTSASMPVAMRCATAQSITLRHTTSPDVSLELPIQIFTLHENRQVNIQHQRRMPIRLPSLMPGRHDGCHDPMDCPMVAPTPRRPTPNDPTIVPHPLICRVPSHRSIALGFRLHFRPTHLASLTYRPTLLHPAIPP